MPDFLRLILLILFLPVIIVVIGPLLVLAAVKGRQQMGPITLDSVRYNPAGRAGIFLLGVAVWLLVWSGLVYLAVEALAPVPGATPLVADSAPAATSTHTPTVAPATATPTATDISPATPTPMPTQSPTPLPTATPMPATSTPSPTPTLPPTNTPSATATPVPATITPTPTTASTTTEASPGSDIRRNASRVEQRAAISAVEEANLLLQQAIGEASDKNLNELERLWQGKALPAIKEFAIEVNSRYAEPFEVDLEYLTPPVASENSIPTQIVVLANEQWSYGGPSEIEQEHFEFIYTVIPQDDTWVISRYTYRNLPTPEAVNRSAN